MRIAFVLSLLVFTGSCMKKRGREDIERDLKTAMSRSLNSDPDIDTSVVKFTVLEVAYFEEKESYACEFKVKMKTNRIDTTGMMSANIAKDFRKVVRKN